MPALECIQSAVGVLLEKMKIGEIVFDAVGMEVAEEAGGRLLIHEEESAEIGIELLDTGANGNEIIVGAQVAQLHFGERFLQAEMRVETVGSGEDAGFHDSEFAHVQV